MIAIVKDFKVVFFGTPDYVDPIIKALDADFDLIKAVRSPSDSFGSLTHLTPDLFVVASFGKIFPPEILKIPKLGAINIHPSKLPLYRGPSPIQAQILDGVSESAISFILMDEEMDHGPILYQEPYRILENDTFESLCKKMFAKSAKILPRVINDFVNNNLQPKSQNHDISFFCDLVKKQDGYFDINNPPDAITLDRMVRAYYPWPTAWTIWRIKNPDFAKVIDRETQTESATTGRQESRIKERIVKFLPNPAFVVPAKAGIHQIKTTTPATSQKDEKYLIQIEGKKPTDLKSFLNGYPDFPLKGF